MRSVRGFSGGAGQPLQTAGGNTVPLHIAGLSASSTSQAGHFTDQNGQPRLMVMDSIYPMLSNAGRWNGSGGGTWQQDIANFCTARAAQGVTAVFTELVASNDPIAGFGTVYLNGNTWDNVPPFNTGQDPASGLNNNYWTRLDYFFSQAQANGITVLPLLDCQYNSNTGECFSGWGTTQYQTFGSALGARYKNQPNVLWLVGDDSFPGASGSNFDNFFTAFLTGLQSAGDTHPISVFWQAEYTSRYATDTNAQSTWGVAHAQWNCCYTYNCGYWIIEYAYGEVANEGAATLLPPAWTDGYRLSGSSTYSSTQDRAWRQEIWWCLTAGARGILTYSTNNYNWDSASSPGSVTTDWSFVNALPNIVAAYSSWTGWWQLLPDLSSAFVTAGRGTRVAGEVSGGSGAIYEPAFTNSWVSASITPTGNLAVCYLPNHTTITCTTAMLAAGWAAHWIDPVSGAASSAGAGPTFNSTAKGSNSQGDPDWVLVFHP